MYESRSTIWKEVSSFMKTRTRTEKEHQNKNELIVFWRNIERHTNQTPESQSEKKREQSGIWLLRIFM